MPKKKNDSAIFVPIQNGFTVSTPLDNLKGKEFVWEPNGLRIEFIYDTAEIHYAGERSGDSGIKFEIPASPKFLRDLAEQLVSKAVELEKLEEGRS